jgi:hypothetical protein
MLSNIATLGRRSSNGRWTVRRVVDVAIVVAYSVLTVAWLIIGPLRAHTTGWNGTEWYLQAHLCAARGTMSCDDL